MTRVFGFPCFVCIRNASGSLMFVRVSRVSGPHGKAVALYRTASSSPKATAERLHNALTSFARGVFKEQHSGQVEVARLFGEYFKKPGT